MTKRMLAVVAPGFESHMVRARTSEVVIGAN